jgi:hypothetical protein
MYPNAVLSGNDFDAVVTFVQGERAAGRQLDLWQAKKILPRNDCVMLRLRKYAHETTQLTSLRNKNDRAVQSSVCRQ